MQTCVYFLSGRVSVLNCLLCLRGHRRVVDHLTTDKVNAVSNAKLKSMPEIAASGSRRSTVVCNSSSLIDKVAKNYNRMKDASLVNTCAVWAVCHVPCPQC